METTLKRLCFFFRTTTVYVFIACLSASLISGTVYGDGVTTGSVIIDGWALGKDSSLRVWLTPYIDMSGELSRPNVRCIFLYVKMDYNDRSEIIWSKIIGKSASKRERRFSRATMSNYPIAWIPNGRVVKMELRGTVFPYIGTVRDVLYDSAVVTTPSVYL